ncbi:hypothetical protein O181_020717 [Austropuccinia psidii MF-1]|uniref:Uncharacterized protein n=1 Tax=Austropuccinia psidii MF-1 TaxID=1389203 RepID=A0A9Q3GVK3_9BASI|nr:hypothetical protein [Austropuccinia psidii MF-1]
MASASAHHRTHARSPFITKSLEQRLKQQDRLILNSSPQQLQKSLESCQRTLSISTFPEDSEPAIVLRQFESKLLTRLNQLCDSPAMAPLHQSNQGKSIGSEGIVGFKRQLIQEKDFQPKSACLMTGISMSQSIKLQEQNLIKQREIATTEAMSQLTLKSKDQVSTLRFNDCSQAESQSEDDDDEIVLTSADQPDIQKAWDLAYQAGFTRGPGDLPQRVSPS